jgi:hypothetical protein
MSKQIQYHHAGRKTRHELHIESGQAGDRGFTVIMVSACVLQNGPWSNAAWPEGISIADAMKRAAGAIPDAWTGFEVTGKGQPHNGAIIVRHRDVGRVMEMLGPTLASYRRWAETPDEVKHAA